MLGWGFCISTLSGFSLGLSLLDSTYYYCCSSSPSVVCISWIKFVNNSIKWSYLAPTSWTEDSKFIILWSVPKAFLSSSLTFVNTIYLISLKLMMKVFSYSTYLSSKSFFISLRCSVWAWSFKSNFFSNSLLWDSFSIECCILSSLELKSSLCLSLRVFSCSITLSNLDRVISFSSLNY